MRLVAAAAVGAIMAVAPAFSGLALLIVLLLGAAVAVPLFAKDRGGPPRPGLLRAWLGWVLAVSLVELWVLFRDDLNWPTLSAIQDPVTTSWPPGRFLAGAAWTLAGFGLLALRRGWGPGQRWWRGLLVGVPLLVLALSTVPDGAMLEQRDAPLERGPTVAITPASDWPATAWLTLAVFTALAAAAWALHRRGRHSEPAGAVPDLLAWLMAPWLGRMIGYGTWLWSGWHFLAR